MLKRNEILSSLTWEMLARKNTKKHKRLVLRLEALYLVKNIFCLYFSPIPKLWSRKKVIFKVFVFWRYSKTLKHPLFGTLNLRNLEWSMHVSMLRKSKRITLYNCLYSYYFSASRAQNIGASLFQDFRPCHDVENHVFCDFLILS